MARKQRDVVDVMQEPIADRRLLPHVPDLTGVRREGDRRDHRETDKERPQYARYAGRRYAASFSVKVRCGNRRFNAHCSDISQTGMQLHVRTAEALSLLEVGGEVHLDFLLKAGVMLEGIEKHFKIKARLVRVSPDKLSFAVRFNEPLYENRHHRLDTTLLTLATMFLFLVAMFILLMRVESVVYFSQNSILYGYSILTAGFLLTRYFFGMLYKPVPVDPDFTPSVTVVIPCFNEETWIRRTIISCVDQDYPPDKLEFIIVDDGSTDGSVEVIKETVRQIEAESAFMGAKGRVRVFLQKKNQGKREAMGLGIRNCRTEFIAFVDSDSFLEPDAIRCLVQPMYDPKVAGVTGRTDVANTYSNRLTKMQSVRYYISFRIMKAAESYFDSVMCLSGPLSCYRLSVVNEVFTEWLNQTFLGQKATFGDDRSLTNFVVRHHQTYYQDTAICSTIVPNRHKVFLKQQMRWKRSWLRESLKAGSFMWRKEPLMAFSFYMGLFIPLIAPLIVIYNLIYIPLTMHVFPTTFLLGLLFMSLMMSFAQLMLKKSTLWIYGLYFCLYYEAILLWQMPWAWVTFWVSSWGTRGGKTKKKKAKKQPHTSAMEGAGAAK